MIDSKNGPKETEDEDDEGGIERSHPKKGGREEGPEKQDRLTRLKQERDEFQKQYPTERGKK